MPDAKKISELPIVETLTASDLFETSHVGTDVPYESCKTSLAQVSNTVAGSLTYGSLQTSNKTIIGAINEALASGGDVSRAEFETLKKSNDALWKLTEGQVYDIETKEETGINVPPSGAQFESVLEVHGKSEQFTTTGKNLLDLRTMSSTTATGVTITPIFVDGIFDHFETQGTASSTIFLKLADIALNGSYILSGCPVYGGDAKYALRYYDGGSFAGNDTGSGITLTFTGTLGIYLRIQSGQNVNGLKFYPMVRLASVTDSTYEPYTGGIPSPNPDYPQEIKAVEEINISVNGAVKTIVPPFPLNKIGDVADMADVDAGVWVKRIVKANLPTYQWSKTSTSGVYRFYQEIKSLFPSLTNVSFIGGISSHWRFVNTGPVLGQFTAHATAMGFAFTTDASLTSDDFNSFIEANHPYVLGYMGAPTSSPIAEDDLAYLKSLQMLATSDNVITITDQDGNDISYLMEYIIKLSEVN